MCCFAEAPFGLLRHFAYERRERHCHDNAFVAVVLSGGYQEAGDEGRWNVGPGDVLVHHAFESHLDRFEARGAEVLILGLPTQLAGTASLRGRVQDAEALARLAERDRRAAEILLAETFVALPRSALDWPDLLANDLREREHFALAEWAESAGLRVETLSRGFRSAYGCTPKMYRAVVRARAAFVAASGSDTPFAVIAHQLQFADQAHMTRAVTSLTGAPPGSWRR